MEAPDPVAAITLTTSTRISSFEGFGAMWNVAIATVPLPTEFFVDPKIKHLFTKHEIELPALVADSVGVTVTFEMSEEYLNVHSRPAVLDSLCEISVIGMATAPPFCAEPDPMESVTLCPKPSW
jgi:hypothetical protein